MTMQAARAAKRNIALGLTLAGVVILFYLMSIVQWHEHSGH